MRTICAVAAVGIRMALQMGSDRVDRCGFIAAILNLFKFDLRNRQGERDSEESETEEIFPTAPMMNFL